jgi:hypothetical protein
LSYEPNGPTIYKRKLIESRARKYPEEFPRAAAFASGALGDVLDFRLQLALGLSQARAHF